jgi:hypothetical protein
MQARTTGPRALFTLLALLASAACKDQTPTLSGDEFFPGGSRPVTLEAIIPASQYLQTVGVYSGYETERSFGAPVIANFYGGALNAHTLQRFSIPPKVSYSLNGVSTDDTLYRIVSARVIAVVDTLGSRLVPTTLQVYRLTQKYDPATASWTMAVDSAGQHTPWTTPGGTTGALLSSALYTPHTLGDSVTLQLDTAQLRVMRPDSVPILLATQPANTRLQLTSTLLRLEVKPSNAGKDTTLVVDVAPFHSIFVLTPGSPAAAGNWQAGGLFGDRTLFSVDLDLDLPGCPAAEQPCPSVNIRNVLLNHVALQLKPLPVPLGYDPLRSVPLELWLVKEPGLGRRAPLVPGRTTNGPVGDAPGVSLPGDTLVELPITFQTKLQVTADSLQSSFALLGQTTRGTVSVRTFGLVRYEPTPRLRIVYTLPTRPRLP